MASQAFLVSCFALLWGPMEATSSSSWTSGNLEMNEGHVNEEKERDLFEVFKQVKTMPPSRPSLVAVCAVPQADQAILTSAVEFFYTAEYNTFEYEWLDGWEAVEFGYPSWISGGMVDSLADEFCGSKDCVLSITSGNDDFLVDLPCAPIAPTSRSCLRYCGHLRVTHTDACTPEEIQDAVMDTLADAVATPEFVSDVNAQGPDDDTDVTRIRTQIVRRGDGSGGDGSGGHGGGGTGGDGSGGDGSGGSGGDGSGGSGGDGSGGDGSGVDGSGGVGGDGSGGSGGDGSGGDGSGGDGSGGDGSGGDGTDGDRGDVIVGIGDEEEQQLEEGDDGMSTLAKILVAVAALILLLLLLLICCRRRRRNGGAYGESYDEKSTHTARSGHTDGHGGEDYDEDGYARNIGANGGNGTGRDGGGVYGWMRGSGSGRNGNGGNGNGRGSKRGGGYDNYSQAILDDLALKESTIDVHQCSSATCPTCRPDLGQVHMIPVRPDNFPVSKPATKTKRVKIHPDYVDSDPPEDDTERITFVQSMNPRKSRRSRRERADEVTL